MLDLTVDEKTLARTVELARERNIVIPTLRQQADPGSIPETVKDGLRDVGMWDIHPLNLFRINWHNQPLERGGGFCGVNYPELPSSMIGAKGRIVALVGKWFPTGAHKGGGGVGGLVPGLGTGQFGPMWPDRLL